MRALRNCYTPLLLPLTGLLLGCIWCSPLTGERNIQATDQLSPASSIVLSKSQLTPPLRTPLEELRFSPDGKYILVQDDSTIYLLTSDPLSVRFQVEARDAEPALFSPDSQKLVIPTRAMGVEWRALPDGAILSTEVLAEGSCHEARLSPQGDLYACIDRNLILRVFDIAKRQQVFAEKIGEAPPSYVIPKLPEDPAPIPLWWTRLRHLPVLHTFLRFSPDGRFVVAASFHGHAIAVDLSRKSRINLLEPFPQAVDNRSFEFIAPDRVTVQREKEISALSILSFPEGGPHGAFPFVGRIIAASDPRYALISLRESDELKVINLQTGETAETFKAEKADILGSNAVRYDRAHDAIILSQTANPKSTSQLSLPAGSISVLNAGAVSGDLQTVAVGVQGGGGVFQTASGKRIAQVANLEGAWFDGDQRCYAHLRRADGTIGLDEINLSEGTVSTSSPPWFSVIDQTRARLMFSGPVVISMLAPYWGGGEPTSEQVAPGSQVRLHSVASKKSEGNLGGTTPGSASDTALDLRTGNELWSRRYNPEAFFQHKSYMEQPIWEDVRQPFADPQGTRFILGWYANTNTARKAAKHASEAVQLQMKTARISGQDSFFEVIDAFTGTTIGGTLVQRGEGPGGFDAVFSTGDWLTLVSGGSTRFSVFSLSSGKELFRSSALYTTISGENGLLGLAEEHGRFSLYDLRDGKKDGEFVLPENVVYAHFSEDGRRLLLITERQSVYILDVSKSPEARTTSGEKPALRPLLPQAAFGFTRR